MSPMLAKSLKRVLLFVALTLVVSLILHLWHATDDEANKSRAFISKNTEVKASVGNVLNIDFKKKLTYHGTTSELGNVEFTYYVRGSAANILIVVRGYGEPTTYKVYRMQNL